jgi:hypothetical protein
LINGDNRPLSGQVAVTIVDKGFASKAVSKKYLGQLADAAKPAKVYHVVI